jgi:soluble lytic murein transglycosylase-like protein
MSILSAIRQQSSSIDDLAKLPQAMIMQMAQKKQISTEMVAPILARKAEMIDAAAKSKAMQGGAPQMSVMEQIMAQNSAAEQPQQMPQQMPTMENAGVAQLPVPERQYAGGGIVAFAKGSMIDLDDDEIDASDDYAKAAAMVQRANAMPVGMPATMPVNAPAAKPSILPQSYEAALAEKGQTPASVRKMMIDSPKKGDYVMPPLDVPKRGGHKYEDMVIKEAQRLGVDPSLALHVLYKETGNLKNPETAKSSAGALGVMQLMPKTAKGLGVDPLDPEENIRGGVTYLKQMYDRYQDPTLALAAYNAGPGRLDKALKSGQGIAGLPRETQNYVVAGRMAGGGEVKHFQYGGNTMGGFELDSYPSDDSLMSPEYQKYFKEYQKELEKRMKSKKDLPPSLQTPDLKTTPIETKRISDGDNVPYVDGKAPPVVQAKIPEIKEKTAMDLFLEQNAADREALGKQRLEDRNMALLAAGLGMLGGESPYAFANIGKGGLSGVSYLSDANKQRAAQQAALDKNRVAAMHYANVGKYYEGQTLSKEEKADLQRQKLEADKIKAVRDDYFQYQKMVEEGFNKQYPMAAITPDDPKTIKLKQEWIAKHAPVLESLRMSAYPNLPAIGSSAPISTQGYKLVK